MDKEDKNVIKIKVLGQEYKITCADSEKDELVSSALFLDQKLREIKESTKLDESKAAIIAALNISRDYLAIKDNKVDDSEINKNIKDLSSQIETQVTFLRKLS